MVCRGSATMVECESSTLNTINTTRDTARPCLRLPLAFIPWAGVHFQITPREEKLFLRTRLFVGIRHLHGLSVVHRGGIRPNNHFLSCDLRPVLFIARQRNPGLLHQHFDQAVPL